MLNGRTETWLSLKRSSKMIVPKGTAWRGAQRQLSAPNVSQNTYLCYTAKGGPATRLHRVQCVMDHLRIEKRMQTYTHVHMCDHTYICTHTHSSKVHSCSHLDRRQSWFILHEIEKKFSSSLYILPPALHIIHLNLFIWGKPIFLLVTHSTM